MKKSLLTLVIMRIDRIELYKDTDKYIVYLKNKKTVKPIKLGTGKG